MTTPLYQIISDALRAKIKAGDFRYNSPICTEKSLCEEYGVSRITAKRAIDELEREGILCRKRGVGSFVLPAAERADYRLPSPPPGEEAAGGVLALMIPFSITQGGIFKAIESATATLALSRCSLTLHVYEPGIENERAMLTALYASGVDGVIYYPSTASLPTGILDRFADCGRPVIILDKPHDNPRYSSVTCDNFEGGFLLTAHLVSYGHRNICYLSRYTAGEVSSIRDRYEGCRRRLAENGGSGELRFVHVDTHRTGKMDYPLLKHIVNTLYRDGVTAIECENDEVAFHVHMCCRSLGIRMPEDMSVTGFDNISWATTGSAQITTAEQDFVAIGKALAELILRPDYIPAHRIIPVRLVPRNSTGPAKG